MVFIGVILLSDTVPRPVALPELDLQEGSPAASFSAIYLNPVCIHRQSGVSLHFHSPDENLA